MEQKLVRAVSSERQLQEVLVDFWFNHFNVSAQKSQLIQPFLTEYERDVIRPHVLGRFRELLEAVAESQAMLIYLDNWLSSDPDAPDSLTRGRTDQRMPAPGQARDQNRFPPRRLGFGDPRMRGLTAMLPPVQPGQRNGLNENYARELLELHTLGVDGGYAQSDVIEVARALTGWTIQPLPLGGGFRFEPRLHDDGEKHVLDTSTDGYGKADGDAVLDLLANHPSTARFISSKLAGHFVADDPPPTLVDLAAARFLETEGDLREVTRTILTSPEFFSADVRRAKVKTPLEFVVSGVRALDGQVASGQRLVYGLGGPRHAILCLPTTDRLFRPRRCVGQRRSTDRQDELRRGPRRRPPRRCPHRAARPRDLSWSQRAQVIGDARTEPRHRHDGDHDHLGDHAATGCHPGARVT